MTQQSQTQVKKRHVLYVPGYDPFLPRRYRELYRSESTEQARISGYDISQSAGPTGENYSWNVEAVIEDQPVSATVEVFFWSDLVQDSMKHNIFSTYLVLLRTAWVYFGSGVISRLFKMRKGPVIAALYPAVALILQLCVALGGAWFIGWLGSFAHALLFWLMFFVSVILILRWFRSIDNKIYVYYLMHDYAYTAKSKGAYSPRMRDRIAQFSGRLTDIMQSDVDEVLLVGHSSGVHIGTSVLASYLREHGHTDGPELSFLSLGHAVPMASFLPDAWEIRRDLSEVSKSEAIFWADVSAPGDGCTFALCDPVAVSGAGSPEQRWPLVFSAAFTQSLSPERWKQLRWRFFRLHFQYLCAFDRPKDYDYFQITAGPKTLAQRYGERSPSKSRIDVCLSPFTNQKP
ncbi:hypothetical protein [Cochlodiniinecator piscidefendens]|uniref:hypothetical protein n=1 Tax=Cochlodiniinecator piscidefendens TaxID=2715756 RepID=UPI00140A40BE|nr:hypothetical protein [Cochlodiniinecator piscidefendens]